MEKTAAYLQQIRQHFPDLAVDSAVLHQNGQYNDVLVVNDALIFRFPKVPEAAETLPKEILLLKSLQDQISLAIPNPIFHHIETRTLGEAFVGYRMIPGQPLFSHEFKAKFNERAIERIAGQLSRFLYELHHISVDHAIHMDLPSVDSLEQWRLMYERIQALLFQFMRPDARQQIAQRFEGFLGNPGVHQFEPALRHGDFGSENILYDPNQLSVTGILDFGGTGLGDPAIDFAGLLVSYGEGFYQKCCSFYSEMEQALDRVHFYAFTFALEEALFGLENANPVAFQNGIEKFV